MAEVGSAFLTVVPSARDFASKLEGQVSPEVKKSGSRLGGFLGTSLKAGAVGLAAGAGAAIGTALFSGFKRLDAIDQAKAKLTGLGHSAQGVDKIMTNALASVKGTAFGLDEAATTAASVVAAGIKPGKQLTGVLKTVADTATIAGTSMADMGTIFGSVAARGKLQGDDLLQLQSRGVPVLAFLAKHYHTTAKAASEMVSAGDVDFKNFAAAMKENLGGAALDSGKTFSGAFANLKASLSRIGANLLSGLFPKVQQGMVKLTGILSQIEPVASKVGAAIGEGLSKIGPVLSQVATSIKGVFSGGGAGGGFLTTLKSAFTQIVPVVTSLAQSIATNFLPVLQQIGTFITGQVVPAVTSLWSYLAAKLMPIFTQVGQIIATQVVPIIASFAQFIYGTLAPAVLTIVQSIATKLKPVFDQLVATFRSQVLPTLQQLLAKFREWQPTIEKVISVVVKIAGKLLEFAAVILGKVLPPAIKFAGWLIATLVPAIAKVIEIVARVIGKVIDFGATLINAGKKVAQFVTKAINEVGKLPGKIGGVFKDVGTWLVDAGKKLIGGLIDGIKDKFNDVKDTLGSLGKKAIEWKGPPAKDKVMLRGNGRLLIDGLIDGLRDRFPGVKAALEKLTKLIQDGVKDHAKKIKSLVDDVADRIADRVKSAKDALKDLKSQAADLKSSVRGAILDTGNLSAFTGQTDADGNQLAVTFADIVKGLTDANGQAKKFQQTLAQLSKLGLNKIGIDQLIAAGPSALANAQAILSGGAAGIKTINSLQASLGKTGGVVGDLAVKTDLGPAMQKANDHLADVVALQKDVKGELRGLRGDVGKIAGQLKHEGRH